MKLASGDGANTYSFLAFSDLTRHLEDTGIGAFWSPDSRETELESSNQEDSPSARKNIGVVLVPSSPMEVRPYSSFRSVVISEILGCHLLQQMSSQ